MKLRIARHTHNLKKLQEFYTQVIGLELTGSFKNHDGYDGIFLSKSTVEWEIEFTQCNEVPTHTFDEDDLLVFYPTTNMDYEKLISRFAQYNIAPSEPKNPYWVKNGIMYRDPDGYGIIISNLKIQS